VSRNMFVGLDPLVHSSFDVRELTFFFPIILFLLGVPCRLFASRGNFQFALDRFKKRVSA